MKKTLIALTVAALPAAAMADVTLYGTVAAGIENNKSSFSNTAQTDTTGHRLQSSTQVNDWTTVIGFKGNEDLGNGLKAIWQVESRVDVDGSTADGSGTLASRDSFVGLTGNFGKVRLGKLSNYGNDSMETFDNLAQSGQQASFVGNILERKDGRVNNAIRYDSPEFAGFSGALLYGTDETRTAGTNNQIWNIGLSYNLNGFFAKYTYEHWGDAKQVAEAGTAGSASKSQRLEFGYDANNLHTSFGYQQVQGYLGSTTSNGSGVFYGSSTLLNTIASDSNQTLSSTDEAKAREIYASVGYTFGNLTPYLVVGKGYKLRVGGSDITGTDYKAVVFGAKYAVTKRTSFIADLGYIKWGDSQVDKERSVGVGVVHNF